MSTSSRKTFETSGITTARQAITGSTSSYAGASVCVHHTLHRISLLIGLIVLLLLVAM